MERVITFVARFVQREHGQDLLEYALLGTLIAVVAVGAVGTLGVTINSAFWQVIAAANL